MRVVSRKGGGFRRRLWSEEGVRPSPLHHSCARVRPNLAPEEAAEHPHAFKTTRALPGKLPTPPRVLAARHGAPMSVPGLVALDHSNLGECLIELDRLAEARGRFESALKRLEGEVGPNDPRLSYPLTGLGRVLVREGRLDEARRVLERSLTIAISSPGDVLLVAQTQWALARALGVDSARGRSLARSSREGFLSASDDESAQRVLDSLVDKRKRNRGDSQ